MELDLTNMSYVWTPSTNNVGFHNLEYNILYNKPGKITKQKTQNGKTSLNKENQPTNKTQKTIIFVNDPPTNVGITTVFVETPGTGYTPGDKIDETVFVYPTGLPDPEGGDAPDPDKISDPELVPDPYTALVPEVDRPVLNKVTDKPVYELVVNPETGGIEAVRVLNILRFETPPVLKVLSKTGQGAVLRPVFGEIPEAVQTGVLTVIDCVGK